MHISRDLGVLNESNISTTCGSLMNERALETQYERLLLPSEDFLMSQIRPVVRAWS